MVRHHNIVFYDPETVWRGDINSDNISAIKQEKSRYIQFTLLFCETWIQKRYMKDGLMFGEQVRSETSSMLI